MQILEPYATETPAVEIQSSENAYELPQDAPTANQVVVPVIGNASHPDLARVLQEMTPLKKRQFLKNRDFVNL